MPIPKLNLCCCKPNCLCAQCTLTTEASPPDLFAVLQIVSTTPPVDCACFNQTLTMPYVPGPYLPDVNGIPRAVWRSVLTLNPCNSASPATLFVQASITCYEPSGGNALCFWALRLACSFPAGGPTAVDLWAVNTTPGVLKCPTDVGGIVGENGVNVPSGSEFDTYCCNAGVTEETVIRMTVTN